MPKFSIVVVSYNSEKYIKACLESVYNQDFTDYEVILIDNASNDRTVEILGLFKDRIELVINDRNKGFPAALNRGITFSKGKYILTLNPDVILESNFLSEVNRNIERFAEDIGMVGVKILKKSGTEMTIDSTGLMLSKAIRFFDRGHGEKDIGQYDKDSNILGPCAAAGIYRKDTLEDIKIKGECFDEDFFYLIEDFDIALRARKKRWKAIYLPKAVCYHTRNSSGTSYSYRQYLSFRNRYFFIIKNIKIKPSFLFYFLIYDVPRLIFMFLTNRRTLKAIRELGQQLSCMLEKRKVTLRLR